MLQTALLDDRAVLAVTGEQASDFLQGLITNDMQRLVETPAIYAGLLTPQGKILFDFFIVRTEQGFLLDCAKASAPDLAKRLRLYKLRSKVDVAETTLAVGAIWGDGEETALPANSVSFADPRLPELGHRTIAPSEAFAAFSDGRAYHRHRIALGVPDSADLPPDKVFALDAGFEELNGVSFKKGCYVGQEVTSRMKHRANARKRFYIVEGDFPSPGENSVVADGREIGTIGSRSDGLALALVRLDRVADAEESGAPFHAGNIRVALRPPPWLKISSSGQGTEK